MNSCCQKKTKKKKKKYKNKEINCLIKNIYFIFLDQVIRIFANIFIFLLFFLFNKRMLLIKKEILFSKQIILHAQERDSFDEKKYFSLIIRCFIFIFIFIGQYCNMLLG